VTRSLFEKSGKLLLAVKNKGFFHLLSANFMIKFLGFGSQLVVAKFLSSVDLGRIKAMQSIIAIAVIFAGLGLNTAVLKLCSENRTLGEKSNILKVNIKLSLVGIVIALSIISLLAILGVLSPDEEINRMMLIFMLSIPSAVIASLLICYLQALKKIQVMAYAQIWVRTLSILALIIFTYYFQLIGFVVSTVVFGFVSLVPFYALTKTDWKDVQDTGDIRRESIFYGKWSVASNSLAALGLYADILLLNYYIEDRAVLGDYALATIFILALNQVTGTVQAIATPYFTEKSNNKEEFIRVLQKYQRLLIAIAGFIFILAVIIVPVFVHVVYPGRFEMTEVLFQILALRYFFWSCYALLGIALLGLGRMRANFFAASIYSPIAFGLSFLFIYYWGPIGAASAQAVSGFIAMVVVYINFLHVLKDHFPEKAI